MESFGRMELEVRTLRFREKNTSEQQHRTWAYNLPSRMALRAPANSHMTCRKPRACIQAFVHAFRPLVQPVAKRTCTARSDNFRSFWWTISPAPVLDLWIVVGWLTLRGLLKQLKSKPTPSLPLSPLPRTCMHVHAYTQIKTVWGDGSLKSSEMQTLS